MRRWARGEREQGYFRIAMPIVALAIVLAGLAVQARHHSPLAPAAAKLSAGTAWLPAPGGLVAMVDGGGGAVVARRRVAAESTSLDVVQSGSGALVVDRTMGTVLPLHGADQSAGAAVRFATPGDGTLRVFPSMVATYVIAGERPRIRVVEPRSLAVVHDEVDFSGDPANTVVTPDGVLWSVRRGTATIERRTPAGIVTLVELPSPTGILHLVRAADRVAVLGAKPGRMWLLDRRNGHPAQSSCLDLPDGVEFLPGGGEDSSTIAAVLPTAAELYIAWPGQGRCDGPIRLDQGNPAGSYGSPVVKQGVVYVPDNRTGEVVVVNVKSATDRVRRALTGIRPGTSFRLLSWSNRVWFDAIDADLAGVVTADLRVVAVVKSGAPDRVDVPPIVLPTVITPVGPVTTNSSSTSEPVTTSTDGDALEAAIDGPASVISGTTVTYSSISNGTPDGFEWTANRAIVGTERSMRTSFATPGSYTVGLTVTKAGASASTSLRVEARAGGVELPDVRGKTEKEARSVLEPTFVVSTRTVEVASADRIGRVVDQNPQPGRAPKGSGVTLSIGVAAPPRTTSVPALSVEDDEATGRAKLTGAQLVGAIAFEKSKTVPTGHVIRTEPPGGTEVKIGASVKIVLSAGKPTVLVPALTACATRDEAVQKLAVADLYLEAGGDVTETSTTCAAGRVLRTDPAAGTEQTVGTHILLVISAGAPTIDVPDACKPGLDQTAAAAAVTTAKLVPNIQTAESTSVPNGQCISQDPPKGAKVAQGQTVTLTFSSGPPADVSITCGPTFVSGAQTEVRFAGTCSATATKGRIVGYAWTATGASGQSTGTGPTFNAFAGRNPTCGIGCYQSEAFTIVLTATVDTGSGTLSLPRQKNVYWSGCT